MALNGIGPNYIHNLFIQHIPARSLWSQNQNLLVQTTAKTKCGKSAFSVYPAKHWNRLPEESKNAPTTSIFKSKLKIKLFIDVFLFFFFSSIYMSNSYLKCLTLLKVFLFCIPFYPFLPLFFIVHL